MDKSPHPPQPPAHITPSSVPIDASHWKVVILAGGFGTRLQEETIRVPKPLVTIGEEPILWHIMKLYYHFGCRNFIICLGYKQYLIKQYFANYFLNRSDVTLDFSNGDVSMYFHNKKVEEWRITFVNTGLLTQTGGRILRVRSFVGDQPFFLTYGDTLADIDIPALVRFHCTHGRLATVTAVQPPGKWGALSITQDGQVERFIEKPIGDGGWINGGFFILNPGVFSYLKEGDETVWEWTPLETLTRDQQLMAYRHRGFWMCMDTLRHRNELEHLWNSGRAPWKLWADE